MPIGTILTNFDERNGFIPVSFSPSNLNSQMVKEIIFRSTLNLVGGSKNISEERETFIDFPEFQLIGCSYLRSVESSAIRGGNMPIITIFFAPSDYRTYIYHNLMKIMLNLKSLMSNIISNWKNNKFQNQSKIRITLDKFLTDFNSSFSGSAVDVLEKESKEFILQCPECSQEISILVPIKIPDLLTMPISNAPCNHSFDAYFTKGPNFRGTSNAKSNSNSKQDLKDIFEKL